MSSSAPPPKRKLIVLKRSEMTEAQAAAPAPKIKTTLREKFRSCISPFLLSIHIRTPHTEDYDIDGFAPVIPNSTPVRLYTWLDSKLADTITSTFQQQHPSIPDEWNILTISSLYVLRSEVNKQLILELGPESKDNEQENHLQMTLYDLKVEIGDHLEFSFE